MAYTDLLKKVEHYLISIDGLYASDQEDFTEPFKLDCKELLDELDKEYWDECDYIEKIIRNDYYHKTDYMIEYGANQRFHANKDLRFTVEDYYLVFLDEEGGPFKVIRMDSIVSIHET